MLTPGYLPTHQKKVCKLVTHMCNSLPQPVFTNPSLKANGELGSSELYCLLGLATNAALSSPQPGISRLALLCAGKWTQVRFSNKRRAQGFPGGTVVENLPANAGDTGSSPGLGRSHMPRSN